MTEPIANDTVAPRGPDRLIIQFSMVAILGAMASYAFLFGVFVEAALSVVDRTRRNPAPAGENAAGEQGATEAAGHLKTKRRLLVVLWAGYYPACALMFATAERWPLLDLRP